VKKYLAGILFALACFASPAHAQVSCNDPGGFLKSFGTINIDDTLILGPDCQHVQSGGSNQPVATFACDGVTNDAVQLQNAINATPMGGTFYIPFKNAGVCLTNATLNFTKPIRFVCDPGVAIKPTAGIGGNSVLYFFGSAFGLAFPTQIENCFIGDPNVNTRFGQYGMVFDTQTAGRYFRNLFVHNVTIKAGTNGVYGILILNNVANNPNGGTFASTIEGGTIEGGLNISGAGDNLAIRDTLIPWNATPGADNGGILISLVTGAGSFLIDHINFSQPGAIIFDGCYSCIIQNSQIEVQAVLAAGAALFVRAGALTMQGFKILNCQFQANAGLGTPLLLDISSNVVEIIVQGNNFATPTSYSPIFNQSVTLQLGPNYWAVGAAAHVSGTAAANTYGGG
jgi:hypothetical protein